MEQARRMRRRLYQLLGIGSGTVVFLWARRYVVPKDGKRQIINSAAIVDIFR